MKFLLPFFTIVFLSNHISPAQSTTYTGWDEQKIVLENNALKRVILLKDAIYTEQLLMTGSPVNYVAIDHDLPSLSDTNPGNTSQPRSVKGRNPVEFQFLLNDSLFNGESGWKVQHIEKVQDDHQGEGVVLTLKGKSGLISGLELRITYLIYPELPVVRKKIAFRNTGTEELKLEGLDIERLNTAWYPTHTVTMAEYGRQKRLGPFTGGSQDPAVAVHDVTGRRGFVLGNEVPGVVKRTATLQGLDGRVITIGLTYPDQDYGFRRWLEPGETWESPPVFIALYRDTDDPYQGINGPVNDFVRRYMGTRLSVIPEKPVFVYNTWNPFRSNINAELIREVADAAAECGVEEFIIDAGWHKLADGWEDPDDNWFYECGDWLIDEEKFPGGLKPVFDHIRSLGMKPGLWISIGQASLHSKVFRENPQYWTRYPDGRTMFLHTSSDRDNASACFSSEWPEYIKKVILGLVRDHGLAYAKLDLAVVTSPYQYDPARTGCYATGHLHRDREESLLMNYERLFQTFDEIHEQAPDLFIDCTFETMGELQLIDYAMCKHAEGNWLSNFEEPSPTGSLRVRNMAWWRSPAIPAARLVIGNPRLDDPNPLLYLKSLAGSLPIMLGDPRELSPEQRGKYRELANWLRSMQEKYNYMMYRQDLAGFGEPLEGHWDGFQRINTDTRNGGIVGVFRQGAAEKTRMVPVMMLDPESRYVIREGPSGKEIARMTGKELAEHGFEVRLKYPNDGSLFEVSRQE